MSTENLQLSLPVTVIASFLVGSVILMFMLILYKLFSVLFSGKKQYLDGADTNISQKNNNLSSDAKPVKEE